MVIAIKPKYFFITCFAFFLVLLNCKVNQDLWCKSHIVNHVNTPYKVIALTFDDGPHEKTTAEILDILKQKHIHATFFALGENANRHPELIQQELRDGHEIGNHGYTHTYLNKNSPKAIETEISNTEREIINAEKTINSTVDKPAFFRPPGGLYNKKLLETAISLGYTTVLWTIDPRDWAHTSTQEIVNTVVSNARPGDIILLHDGLYPLHTPEAVSEIIDALQQQGYTFVTVNKLLELSKERNSSTSYNIYDW